LLESGDLSLDRAVADLDPNSRAHGTGKVRLSAGAGGELVARTACAAAGHVQQTGMPPAEVASNCEHCMFDDTAK